MHAVLNDAEAVLLKLGNHVRQMVVCSKLFNHWIHWETDLGLLRLRTLIKRLLRHYVLCGFTVQSKVLLNQFVRWLVADAFKTRGFALLHSRTRLAIKLPLQSLHREVVDIWVFHLFNTDLSFSSKQARKSFQWTIVIKTQIVLWFALFVEVLLSIFVHTVQMQGTDLFYFEVFDELFEHITRSN